MKSFIAAVLAVAAIAFIAFIAADSLGLNTASTYSTANVRR